MWRCPYCETFNEDTDNFCAICGGNKTASPKAETASETARPAAAQTPANASPAPRPRPANMWDNGEGLGGATDLKALAAKREAEHREKKVRDAEIRKKLAASKPDTDKDAEYERLKYEGRSGSKKQNRGALIAFLIILAALLFYLYMRSGIGLNVPPAGTAISLTESEVPLRDAPKNVSYVYDKVSTEDSIRYLGIIETDATCNRWCKVSVNGVVGYIDLDYIEFE